MVSHAPTGFTANPIYDYTSVDGINRLSSNDNAVNATSTDAIHPTMKVQDVGSILDILYSSQVKQSAGAAMAAANADLLIANNNVPVLLEDLHMNLKVHQGGYSGYEADMFYYDIGKYIWLPRLREFVHNHPFPNEEYIRHNIFSGTHNLPNISQKLSTLITLAKRLWDACGRGHIGDTCSEILMVGYEMESIDDMRFSHNLINMLTIDYEASIEVTTSSTC
jgi:hypothetical protein